MSVKSDGLILGISCECPDNCDEVIYTQEMSQANLRLANSQIFDVMSTKGNYLWLLDEQIKNSTKEIKVKALKEKRQEVIDTSSVVHFYFKEPGIVKYTREELYGTMDVIGNYIIANYPLGPTSITKSYSLCFSGLGRYHRLMFWL